MRDLHREGTACGNSAWSLALFLIASAYLVLAYLCLPRGSPPPSPWHGSTVPVAHLHRPRSTPPPSPWHASIVPMTYLHSPHDTPPPSRGCRSRYPELFDADRCFGRSCVSGSYQADRDDHGWNHTIFSSMTTGETR